MKNQTLKTLLLSSLLIAATSCSFTKGKGLAESAVTQFHNNTTPASFTIFTIRLTMASGNQATKPASSNISKRSSENLAR